MVNTPAKILLALSAFAGATAVVYGVASGDRSGAVLFAAVLVAALLAALAVLGSAGADPLDPEGDDDVVATVTYGPDDVARPSPWPLIAAAAAGLIAVGAAEGPAYVIAGMVLAALVGAAWTGQVWREHPSFTPRLSARMGQRVLVPGLLPVAAFLLAALIAISLSRILLAVSKDGSVLLAFTAATVILLTCAVVAYRPRLTPNFIFGLVAAGALLAGTAGVVGAAAGERPIHPESESGPRVELVAHNTAFDKKEIKVPAAEAVHVEFDNRDEVFHDFAVYTTDGKPVFASRPLNHDSEVFDMKIAQPGSYAFVCDFHPNMKGDLVVG